MSDHDDSSPTAARSLFADYLGRLERGEPADFEALCREHPVEAAELRRLKVAYDALYEKLREARPRAEEVPRGSLLERLQEVIGADVDPGISIHRGGTDDSDFTRQVVAGLARRSRAFGRYRLDDEIAKGGMGVVLRVWDEDLRRWLAMKLIRARRAGEPAQAGTVDSRTLGRFLDEAQVTGQLDHPGIVPIHELGLDAEGRVYFTMKLVEGQTLQAVFDELARGEGGWTQTRVLGLLLKVCEAMSYAHAKRVIHRDLKPSNVMVGRYGEVYVMDWGLARLLGQEDRRDVRIQAPAEGEPARAESQQRDRDSPESPLLTRDGEVLGTPVYMPPEQASGQVERIDERSDVYALGAMLYELLAGRPPYVLPGERPRAHVSLARVCSGPPRSLAEVAPDAPGELVAICERAMARDRAERYADMSELSRDLSDYLEGRVVRAFESGAWAEARKWVRRNRGLASALAAALLLALGGTATVAGVQAQGRRTANELRITSEENERNALEEKEGVLRLADLKRLEDLLSEERRLWPILETTEEMEAWIERASDLVDRTPRHRRGLEELRERALHVDESAHREVREMHPRKPVRDAAREEMEALLVELERELEPALRTAFERRVANLATTIDEIEAEIGSQPVWRFSDTELEWQHDLLAALVGKLERLADPDPLVGTIASVANRLEKAQAILKRSRTSPAAERLWEDAVFEIAESDLYNGLEIPPQAGLLPIGPDPESGLWEFAHLETGEPPLRDSDQRLVLTEETGLVLVLIPGGTFIKGAQSIDPAAPSFDPGAFDDEYPLVEQELEPFFLSKFEMNQGQWQRVTGENPSRYRPSESDFRWDARLGERDQLNPVEQISWLSCSEVLRRLGLDLPTEAQWEYAARARSTTPWWTGERQESLQGAANLADRHAREYGAEEVDWKFQDWLDDGATTHARIGSYRANAFGLHDTVGNVWEWCRDGYANYARPVRSGDGEVLTTEPSTRIARGGSFSSAPERARSAFRQPLTAEFQDDFFGVRPARSVERP